MATFVDGNSKTVSGESQLVLIVDDDEMITEGLAAGLEREGRTLITCNDIESAELVVERMYPSHIVADVRFSGPFAYEGLDFIGFAKKHAPETRIILISGDAPEALQLEASERGAVAFLKKPFPVSELDGMLDLLHCSATSALGGYARVIRMAPLDEIIRSDQLRPQFQPIVRLDGAPAVFGYEALARYRTDSFLRDPSLLFKYASRKNRVVELELACMSRALHDGAALSRKGLLFLNVHPAAFASADFHETVASQARGAGVDPARIVLEITEQGSLANKPAVIRNVGELRELGVRFAFDDLGMAYSHLPMMDAVRPSFLKVSQDFGTSFEKDTTRTKIVMNILSLARDFESDLILEGIEEESTAVMATHLSIPLGQGYYFARPAEASELL
ncbi:MAG: EAL domain-containing protein [Thermoanaerobaculia bacterium]|jgi:EAL domain-containing protein (putative c-di-GMP-specific phosphodiesterase class I)/ActR/RegA family two-component response regulator